MKDQRTRQNTIRRSKNSSAQSSYKLPQLERPSNDSHFYQQGTTYDSEKQLPIVHQIQTLPRASSHLQHSEAMDRSLFDLAHLSRLSSPIFDRPTAQTASHTSPSKLEKFTDKTVDQTHSRSNHARIKNHQISEDRRYICTYPDCGKIFKQRGNLKSHERKHTGDKPYQCLFQGCGKAFAQMGNLQTHEKVHWLVKPYICDYPNCNRGFTQRINLKAHISKIHHVTPS